MSEFLYIPLGITEKKSRYITENNGTLEEKNLVNISDVSYKFQNIFGKSWASQITTCLIKLIMFGPRYFDGIFANLFGF